MINPQSIRQSVSLNGEWDILLDEKNIGIANGWYKNAPFSGVKLNIPGCVQSLDEFSQKYPSHNTMRNKYKGNYWLEKEIVLPNYGTDKKYYLKFGGIAPAAHIWVNSGYSGFYDSPQLETVFDITGFVTSKTLRVTVLIAEQDASHMGGMRSFGFDWSGLYRDVSVEIISPLHAERLYVDNTAESEASVSARIINEFEDDKNITAVCSVKDCGNELTAVDADIFIKSGESFNLQQTLDISGLVKWSCDNPKLYDITLDIYINGELADSVYTCTGFRSFTAGGSSILLNGEPFHLRGVGHEYFSVSISPIIDTDIIKRRFASIKAHGFNFCRYHTYPPTEEELACADETGIILSSEIALVSNFSKVTPAEVCLDIIEKYVAATKHHPSLGIYCLGNEGSQLMVNSYIERQKAVSGYNLIKKTAPNHFVMISFGMQAELPDLPNDIESPHLWSHDFLWSYDGLSDIPWAVFESLPLNKPWIVHEYGKFGVWPDPKEENIYPENGYKADFGRQGRMALAETGLEKYEELIIKNSRSLYALCVKNIVEDARRQRNNSGYVLWTFFRKGVCNSGFIDDMGLTPDTEPDFYAQGCNAPVALLLDRVFAGRNIKGGDLVNLNIYISNFGKSDIKCGRLVWSLHGTELTGSVENISSELGICEQAAEITLSIPHVKKAARLILKLRLSGAECGSISENQWNFWVFPATDNKTGAGIAYDFTNNDYKLTFRSKFPGCAGLRELDSAARGCRSWAGSDYNKTLEIIKPKLLVTDRYGEAAKACIAAGVPVMLTDTGNFPEHWYTKPTVPHLGEDDTSRFFTSFRSGWDQGNISTIIHEDRLIEDFPHEGFCDLQFYPMVNGARAVTPDKIAADIGAVDLKAVIRSIAKKRPPHVENAVVQDPNAVKELEIMENRKIFAMDRVFLAKLRAKSTVIINTLRLTDDIAGEFMAGCIFKYATEINSRSQSKCE